jgi:hypothetical protein
LKINNPSPAPTTQLVELTRDLAAVAGDVATTGIGFQPARLDVVATVGLALVSSYGFSDVDGHAACVYRDYLGNQDAVAALVFIQVAVGSAQQYVSAVTYGADGFTLTWAKNASPTGIVKLKIMASK